MQLSCKYIRRKKRWEEEEEEEEERGERDDKLEHEDDNIDQMKMIDQKELYIGRWMHLYVKILYFGQNLVKMAICRIQGYAAQI